MSVLSHEAFQELIFLSPVFPRTCYAHPTLVAFLPSLPCVRCVFYLDDRGSPFERGRDVLRRLQSDVVSLNIHTFFTLPPSVPVILTNRSYQAWMYIHTCVSETPFWGENRVPI